MAEDGAGAEQNPPGVGEAETLVPGDPAWRDWKSLPVDVLANVAGKAVAQTEAGWAAWLKKWGWSEEQVQEKMAKRELRGPSRGLLAFAMVCKDWREAQLKVGGPLCTRVHSDVAMPGSEELAKWALAGRWGCPRDDGYGVTMAHYAAEHGHGDHEYLVWELLKGQGFATGPTLMEMAARSGNLRLVQDLRDDGCEWDHGTCRHAVDAGHKEVLRWVRLNGCPWDAATRDKARIDFWGGKYTGNFGILVRSGEDWDEYSDDEW